MLQAFISSALALISHIFASYCMAEHRFSKRLTLTIWSLYGVVTAAFWLFVEYSGIFENQMIIAYYSALVLQIALFFATTRGNVGQRAFLQITYTVLFSVSGGVLDILRYSIFKAPLSLPSLTANALIVALLLWLFLGKLLPLVKKTGQQIESWWSLCGISLLFFVAVVCLTIWPRSLITASASDILIYAVFVLLVCAVYPVLFGNLRAMALVSKAKQTELHRNLLLSQVEAQRAVTEAARRSRHDLRHHDLVIAEYAKNGDIAGLLDYLGQREESGQPAFEESYCENETLSHILAVYLRRAKQAGIRTDVQAMARQALAISQSDMVSIVANILENALHGCEESGALAPYIGLSIHEKSDKLVISCENSCKKTLHFSEVIPGSLRGIGVSSIEAAASRYDGACDFSAADGSFKCGVILNLTSQGE